MTRRALETILGRSILDDNFRILLFADPERALAGYSLTKEERIALLAIDAETLDAFAERLGVHLGTGGRQAGPTQWP